MRVNQVVKALTALSALILWLFWAADAKAQYGQIFKDIRGAVSGGGGRSNARIVEGLKEALRIGTEKAVAAVSRKDGFLAEEAIRIILPPSVKRTEVILRAAGYGTHLDDFEKSMNRAAEKAAPMAKDVFIKALSDMTFADAEKILKGEDTSATQYFREKTQERLFEDFRPVIHNSLEEVGVTKQYLELEKQAKRIPFADSFSFDLDEYVTKGALNGLFVMLGREEKKIRHDPAARVTELLKEVFGKK
jgi:hypothetical protein